MIVVASLSMVIFLAEPRSASVTPSSVTPRSSVIARPPVRMAIFQHGFAAIAEAGRLDRGGFQRARELVDDQRGQRFTLDVFGDDEQRPPPSTTCSSTGRRSFIPLIFFS